jgi:hypothetical protein
MPCRECNREKRNRLIASTIANVIACRHGLAQFWCRFALLVRWSDLLSVNAFSWLTAATPVWLSLCVIAALGAVAWQLWRTIKRIDRHARSIAHMDEWADVVDQSLTRIEERTRRAPPPAAPAPRSAVDFKKWGQK